MAITVMKHTDGTFTFSGRSLQPTKEKNEALKPYGCIVHDYGTVLCLLPDSQKASALNQQIGNARFLKRRYLDDRNAYYTESKKVLSVNDYKKNTMPKLKEEYNFLKLSDKFALEAALEQVDDAFDRFYKGLSKFPKKASDKKPSGNSYTTKMTNNNIALEINEEDGLPYIKLPKVGRIRFVLPKGKTIQDIVPAGTHISSATIKRSGKEYTVSLKLETVIQKPELYKEPNIRDVLGLDLGIKMFATMCQDGKITEVENPRWIRLHAKRLRRFQQALARKQYNTETHKGSKNYEKAKLRVAKEMRKCANQRKDFHHKLSRKIADSCSVFVCEDLNIKGMVKNRHLSKEISSVGWASFINMVKYKMERQGKRFIKVGRFFASSQLCHQCGYQNPEVKDLSVREWTCPSCGTKHGRDDNAAINLVKEGYRILLELIHAESECKTAA